MKISSPPTPGIIITGVPSKLHIKSDIIIERILITLDATCFVNDILDIRQQVIGKNKSNTENTPTESKSSYIIKFKSEYIARHIIMLKRRKGLLKVSQVFDCTSSGNIYVNEFLTTEMHSLYFKGSSKTT
ncbi:hypothetical protein PV328_001016 [Microctonus aethiopoides]|uniref:Uncharacterized protein n=1 Tax=Microctonus aethiopoides TaxID=144406 RepID=A0AA39KWV3_9HYME|nr:hypothetical protein PV328_001016 [Microctonus aethiopoides]